MKPLDFNHQPLFEPDPLEVPNDKDSLLINKTASVATAATDSPGRKPSDGAEPDNKKKKKRFNFIPEGKRLRCLPLSRKKKKIDKSVSKRKRLQHWWHTSVMPTCLTRRRNGEGKFSKKDDSSRRSTKETVERHDVEVPILPRNVQIVQPTETKVAPESVTSQRPSKQLQQKATIQLARTVLPPPPPSEPSESRHGSVERLGVAAVIPRGLSSEADLGKRRSLWKFKGKRRKGVLPVQHKASDMYKEVVPNDVTNNPMWSKAP
eukprot:Protomagalhaensia_wolfi_Nauph_80__1406@NODE_1841_length_1312_cov_652_998429_g1439_i0_p1_GENE_NODE_1841_length_1312_cov_652_998429_g1439_i0NODE_1841_length_1312_cov_652_998429_g1439_i0_p1_ORF_typecomplete_len300_score37_19_NODE_1841_length_1312_cov_652_998429_g1439_i04121200